MYIKNNGNSDKYNKVLHTKSSTKYSRFFSSGDTHCNPNVHKKLCNNNYKYDASLAKTKNCDTNSIGNGNKLINITKLRQQRAEEARIYGQKSCLALFKKRPDCIVRAWFLQEVIPIFKEVLHWMACHKKAYHIVDNIELIKVSKTKHHHGVCFLIKKRNGITVQQWVNQAGTYDCVLAPKNVGNPRNLGSIIRSCAYFGIKGILLQDVTILESGATICMAEGGAEHVQPLLARKKISNALEEFRIAGYTIVTITRYHVGISLFKVSLPRKMVLLLNQECYDLSSSSSMPSSRLPADINISIDGTGNINSLNISVVTSLLLSEWWRQNKA